MRCPPPTPPRDFADPGAGTGAITYSLPIAPSLRFAIVVTSTGRPSAPPGGGGAFIVADENLGVLAGLIAAASLLIDYILTVSVSIAACVEAIVSANQAVHPYAVPLAVGLVGLISLGNLRGLRESGTAFSIPTYGFVVLLSATIGYGMFRVFTGDNPNVLAVGEPTRQPTAETTITLFLILRAFSAGCTALTGVEAISNGVSAFKPPEWKNAATTMTAMALILGSLFLGTTLLARHFGIIYEPGDRNGDVADRRTRLQAQRPLPLAPGLHRGHPSWLRTPASTASPLGPSARDTPAARLYQRGNRLVFSYGIFMLAALLAALVVFNATPRGSSRSMRWAFSFTLVCGDGEGWPAEGRRLATLGHQRQRAIATCAVFFIILMTKVAEGGWMVVLLLPMVTIWLYRIGGFYKRLRRELHVPREAQLDFHPRGPSMVPIVVPVEEINLATVMTLGAACEQSRDVTALHVIVDPDEPSHVEERWHEQFPAIPLVVIDSPYRTVAEPIVLYVNDRLRDAPHEVTVMVPLLGVRRGYHRPLVNQSLRQLKSSPRRHVNVGTTPLPA
jgi:amino acid transporter